MKRIIVILALVLIVMLPMGVSAKSDISVYVIRATAYCGGSISPSGTLIVYGGESVTYTITPNTGYRIFCVFVDWIPRGAISQYTFMKVSRSHTITALFIKRR